MATRKRAAEIDPLAGKRKKTYTPDPVNFPAGPRKGAPTKTRPVEDHKPKRPKAR